ncbi:MAG TPA: RnfABCDGE type electron transport complex subunit D [Burkholderiales bacterium]
MSGPAPEALAPVSSPHAHGGASVARTMFRVQVALAPATLFGFWMFGWPAIFLFLFTVAASALAEFVCQRLRGTAASLLDGSALLTGWLLALSLPPWAPWWIGVLGGAIAIILGKQVYGGLGQNLFNPAMVARVALLISFPAVMTQWVHPLPIHAPTAPGFADGLRITLVAPPLPDAVASASPLGHHKTELSRGADPLRATAAPGTPDLPWSGLRAGSLGETATLLLLCGGLYLLACGIITWHIPIAVLAGIALPAALAHGLDPARHLGAEAHLLGGATLLGAFFIATDYVTSPGTPAGKLAYGVGIGLLTWVIRSWGGYPEGMAFAVLLMNAVTPVIDRYTRPRILGRRRDGREIGLPAREAKP